MKTIRKIPYIAIVLGGVVSTNAAWAVTGKAEVEQSCVSTITAGDLNSVTIEDIDVLRERYGREMGQVAPAKIAVVEDRLMISSLKTSAQSPSQFFITNILPQFAKLDAKNAQAFYNSFAIQFLQMYGTAEASLLKIDLNQPDLLLDKNSAEQRAPSRKVLDETNASIAELSKIMSNLLEPDQKSILENFLSGNVRDSFDQMKVKFRDALGEYEFTKKFFAELLTDRKQLLDLENLLKRNEKILEETRTYLMVGQPRFQKVAEATEFLANEGELILAQKDAVLASISDPYTKEKVAAVFDLFSRRVTSLFSATATGQTYVHVWEKLIEGYNVAIFNTHETINFTMAVIILAKQAENAMDQLERNLKAYQLANQQRNALIARVQGRLGSFDETSREVAIAGVKENMESMKALLATIFAVQAGVSQSNQMINNAMAEARVVFKEIIDDAKAGSRRQP